MNIAESCFRADPAKTAILSASELTPDLRRVTYEELWRLSARVANGLAGLGVGPQERVALYMPMTPEAVAIYLGVVLAGRCVVGIADTVSPPDLEKRVRIGAAKAVFTIDAYRRGGKDIGVYEKVVEAGAPRAVVLPSEGQSSVFLERREDVAWEDFLGEREPLDVADCAPSDLTNVLFSSGTTKDPKAIPWTHTTPIKCAADAYLHMDTRPTDVLAWPTSFGWMMGPWLTYASLVNRATMALYVGDTQGRGFGEFVSRAGVTILGVVPKLVRAWKARRTMEGLDWDHIRLFASTAEPSVPEEMFYLMWLAGFKPVVEYCGGTEVGGGYLTGTLVQPCAPSTFTTPALGLDFLLYDGGKPADRGEVFLIPPSIGLSNELLNYDHHEEYFAGLPEGPAGEVLRRHGDQVERLGGGYYRHHGRIDDVINIGGVKTSSEEIRAAIWNEAVYDAKPVAVDVDGNGQQSLVVYAVPRDPRDLSSDEARDRLRQDFERSIRARLSPLLAHVRDVILVPDLPQAGPGKTRTMADLQRDYLSRTKLRA
jgi:acetyl-CoA synthetase